MSYPSAVALGHIMAVLTGLTGAENDTLSVFVHPVLSFSSPLIVD